MPYRCSSDSDEEPVTKQPRLSRRHSRGSGRESPGQSARSTRSERSKRHRATRSPRYSEDPAAVRADLSDTDASSENRSVGEGSYFEVRTYLYSTENSIPSPPVPERLFIARESTECCDTFVRTDVNNGVLVRSEGRREFFPTRVAG